MSSCPRVSRLVPNAPTGRPGPSTSRHSPCTPSRDTSDDKHGVLTHKLRCVKVALMRIMISSRRRRTLLLPPLGLAYTAFPPTPAAHRHCRLDGELGAHGTCKRLYRASRTSSRLCHRPAASSSSLHPLLSLSSPPPSSTPAH